MLVHIDEIELKKLLNTFRSEAGEDAVKITSKTIHIGEGIEAYVVWIPGFKEPEYDPEFDK